MMYSDSTTHTKGEETKNKKFDQCILLLRGEEGMKRRRKKKEES